MTRIELRTKVPAAGARRAGLDGLPRTGPWELIHLAAEGAIAQVYRARPRGATEDAKAAYAVKTLKPDWQDDPRAVELLRREAALGRKISHAHLVSVLSASFQAEPYYLVMPWLEGATLATLLNRREPLDPPLAFWIARQAAEGLGALFEAGWTHGDVKPGNLMVSTEGHVTLLDLGFARRIDRPDPVIEPCVAGTTNYMAPEAAAVDSAVDIRSDLYSLGVVLFEMLTGRPLFFGDDAAEIARRHREERVPELTCLVPRLPSEAAELVHQLLAKQQLRRPETPWDVAARLARLEIATFLGRAS